MLLRRGNIQVFNGFQNVHGHLKGGLSPASPSQEAEEWQNIYQNLSFTRTDPAERVCRRGRRIPSGNVLWYYLRGDSRSRIAFSGVSQPHLDRIVRRQPRARTR